MTSIRVFHLVTTGALWASFAASPSAVADGPPLFDRPTREEHLPLSAESSNANFKPELACLYYRDGGLAEDKSAYPDAVCTWVEAAKEGDSVSMANGYRMFNQPGGWGYRSR